MRKKNLHSLFYLDMQSCHVLGTKVGSDSSRNGKDVCKTPRNTIKQKRCLGYWGSVYSLMSSRNTSVFLIGVCPFVELRSDTNECREGTIAWNGISYSSEKSPGKYPFEDEVYSMPINILRRYMESRWELESLSDESRNVEGLRASDPLHIDR